MNKKINYFGRVTIEYITEDTINIMLKVRDSDIVLLNSTMTLRSIAETKDKELKYNYNSGLSYADALLLHKLFSAIGMLINNNKLDNTPEYQFHCVELIHYAGNKYVDNLKNLLISFTFMDNILSRSDSFAFNFNTPLKEEMFEDNTLKMNMNNYNGVIMPGGDVMCIGVDNKGFRVDAETKEISEFETVHPSGYEGVVTDIDKDNGIVNVAGLNNEEIGELVEFNNGDKGMIINVCQTYGDVKVIIFSKYITLTKSSRCKNLNKKLELPKENTLLIGNLLEC